MTAETISKWLLQFKLSAGSAEIAALVLAALYLAVLAWLANFITKRFITSVIHPLIHKTGAKWDDKLAENGVLIRFSHIVPAAIIHIFTPTLFQTHPQIIAICQVVVNTYLIVITLFIIDGVLNFCRSIWDQLPVGKRFPAKSFIQAIKLVINLVGCIFILSVVLGKSPLVFFSGLGAVTAILLLIFKDAILGLVAGFQLSVNNMVMVGDWIEMPARGADGDVIDVSLTTVKVQNWDKTITTIPTYALISDSFKNWRGMSESGGRRIKRSLNIDLRTLQFADETLLERFKHIRILRPYLKEKLEDIQKHNDDVGDDLSELINGRRLTNVGTFRAYCVAYLRNHPKIHQSGMTLLVRQLAPTEKGLPIELYAFSSDTAWANFEDIQGDIFDHLLSILPEFQLSAFQAPSGADLEKAIRHLTDSK
ncbi:MULTISPECIES: mechanosensitive ion channel family protein [unclassified Lentimonas]|uniref:mechanosensitive ion channel family protein n=1 Tax=unclassified Lentimonas TaxID=2630993 RepID=UPI001320988F|nr:MULTISPECIES: mechanosensitive ion channel family protein [unclassified Lentimonas]CAA6678709.1 Small-conductance mechanosensitive channel [Lentimonas sp. CC4]CAA6683695.1 Small-conductance mechanosensitive channel [Lentimonas sp. CC6]CAA6691312.1 Small-conductance mechanosensitive channel [Lentimonas sp. CC19]CAA6694884.1 Small-conductance mechanosensitive channel [Lentimonas sp. CC10]CAA7071924.1 Small-conductance mechanosensitive channel [Lentimonas sp. CC11]